MVARMARRARSLARHRASRVVARRRASSRVVASTPRGALASHVVARMFPRLVASAFATGVACAGVVVGYGAALGGRACDCERVDARARDAAYDREAKTFDDAVRSSEYWSGIENMRASLAYGARGDVSHAVGQERGRDEKVDDAEVPRPRVRERQIAISHGGRRPHRPAYNASEDVPQGVSRRPPRKAPPLDARRGNPHAAADQ